MKEKLEYLLEKLRNFEFTRTKVLLFTGAGLLSWMIFFDEYSIPKNMEYSEKIEELSEEINKLENDIKTCVRNKEELQSDCENLEKFAREKYLMKKDNEVIFLVE